jgi:hypothetical protein
MVKWVVGGLAVVILGIMWWKWHVNQGVVQDMAANQISPTGSGLPAQAGTVNWHPIMGPALAARSGRGHF